MCVRTCVCTCMCVFSCVHWGGGYWMGVPSWASALPVQICPLEPNLWVGVSSVRGEGLCVGPSCDLGEVTPGGSPWGRCPGWGCLQGSPGDRTDLLVHKPVQQMNVRVGPSTKAEPFRGSLFSRGEAEAEANLFCGGMPGAHLGVRVGGGVSLGTNPFLHGKMTSCDGLPGGRTAALSPSHPALPAYSSGPE